MRLTSSEAQTIAGLARERFGSQTRVFLFGSRTDDAARGGDIDLYIETTLDTPAALRARMSFAAALFRALGDQKIDIVVKPADRPPTAFESLARAGGIAL